MRHLLSFIVVLFLVSHCTTPEKCGEIYDKVNRDGRYFFILDANYSFDVSTENDNASFLPDDRLSGEVSQSVYNTFSIGEEYCQ
jgi:hypothetical protein